MLMSASIHLFRYLRADFSNTRYLNIIAPRYARIAPIVPDNSKNRMRIAWIEVFFALLSFSSLIKNNNVIIERLNIFAFTKKPDIRITSSVSLTFGTINDTRPMNNRTKIKTVRNGVE